MILDKYDYRYALVPYEVAKSLGLGWRKVDSQNRVLLNQTELRGLEGNTFEEQVKNVGGTVLTAEDARYYAKTTTLTVYVAPLAPPVQHTVLPEPEQPEQEEAGTDDFFTEADKERPVTLPSFPRRGTG